MIPVYLESPFRGKTKEETRQNIIYAQLCMADSLRRGEAPFLSHLVYTQVWSEENRDAGIMAGRQWLGRASAHVFYLDLGTSEGMQRAFDESPFDAWQIKKRTLGKFDSLDFGSVESIRGWLSKVCLIPFPELGWVAQGSELDR